MVSSRWADRVISTVLPSCGFERTAGVEAARRHSGEPGVGGRVVRHSFFGEPVSLGRYFWGWVHPRLRKVLR